MPTTMQSQTKHNLKTQPHPVLHGLHALCACAIILVGTMTAAAERLPTQEGITLEEAVDLALRDNLSIRTAREERRRATGRIQEATAGAYPHVTLSSAYNRTDDVPTGYGDDEVYSAELGVAQPLYLGGKVSAARGIAQDFQRAVEEGIRGSELDAVFAVYKQFYSVLLARQDLAVAEESNRLADENRKEVQSRFDQGAARKFDLLRAEEQTSRAHADVILAENALEIRRASLFTLLRMPPDAAIAVEGGLSFRPEAREEIAALRTATENRPDLREQEIRVAMQEGAVRIAQAGLRPAFSLVAGAGYIHPDRMFQPDEEDVWSAGVVLEIPVFDGFLTRGKVAQERATLSQQVFAVEQLNDRIRLEITQAVLTLRSAEERVRARITNLDQAREALRLAQSTYHEGLSQQLDVLDAQLRFTDARRAHARALFDHVIARAALQKATGTLVSSNDLEGIRR